MQDATVIPDNQITRVSFLLPDKFRSCSNGPNLVQQRFTLNQWQSRDISPFPATEIQGRPASFIMAQHHRVYGTGCVARIIKRIEPRSQDLPLVARCPTGSLPILSFLMRDDSLSGTPSQFPLRWSIVLSEADVESYSAIPALAVVYL